MSELFESNEERFGCLSTYKGLRRNAMLYPLAIFAPPLEPPLEGTLRKTRVIKAHLSILATSKKKAKIPENRLHKPTFGDFILELLIRFERTTCSLRVSCSTG